MKTMILLLIAVTPLSFSQITNAKEQVSINPAAIIITLEDAIVIASQKVSGEIVKAAIAMEEETLVWALTFIDVTGKPREFTVGTSSGVVFRVGPSSSVKCDSIAVARSRVMSYKPLGPNNRPDDSNGGK